MSFTGPPIENLLAIFWDSGHCAYGSIAFQSSNLVFGANPLYQIDDFLAVYPKFGTQPQAILAATVGVGGSGYAINDVLTIVQDDASGGMVTVNAVDGGGGVTGIAAIAAPGIGKGYSVASGLPTTGGGGTDATISITQITSYASTVNIPQAVLQMYINLASASLTYARWAEYWQMCMGLFVAHFCTLYLRSEGNVGTTAGQVANSGLEKGLTISKAAGDVSMGIEMLADLEGWGMWRETTYGTQLATLAKVVGMGPSYVW